ncbi:MAG: DEAD/DEAH box helicase [Thermoguttaceae bacterium]
MDADPMTLNLVLSPSGRLSLAETPAEQADLASPGLSEAETRALVAAFAAGQSEGLFHLAGRHQGHPLGPSLDFWKEFAAAYLAELCHVPEGNSAGIEPVPPPNAARLAEVLGAAPPMRGAEYLDEEVLTRTWRELDEWVRGQLASARQGLSSFLQEHAPLWHQVGRVCFHLAENRSDPDYPFAFLATYAPTVSRTAKVQYQPLSRALQEYAGARNKTALVKLLSPVHQASQKSQFVRQLVESGDIYHPLAWTPREAYRFLTEMPLLDECGVLVRLPDWWKKRPRPRVSVTVGEKRQKRFDAGTMLDFKLELALGDEKLTEREWKQLMQADEGLVLLRGQWVEVDRQKMAEALEHWQKIDGASTGGVSFVEGMRLLAGADLDAADQKAGDPERQWSFVQAGGWLGQVLADMRNPQNLDSADLGCRLRATLRPYQQVGAAWLRFMSRLGLGACLADDMGLGKTIQVLALLTSRKATEKARPSLLVLPASLLGNWRAELARFAPTLRPLFVHPSESPRQTLAGIADDPAEALAGVDLVLTTYGMLSRQSWLLDVDWSLVVLDEAQAIKSAAANQARTVKRLKSEARIALTGTPVENRLADLWSLFDFLCPGLLGSQQKFKQFVKRLNERQEARYAPLRGLVQPYILRRLKTDKRIISDLPEKTEVRAYCSLTKRQAALYAKMVDEMARALENLEGIKRRGLVLAYLMRFKQLCNHPSHLLGDGQFEAAESGKFQRLAEICEQVAERQEKALVFTQFREITDPLSRFLASQFGRPGLVLHGGTAVGKRKELVDRFQRDDGPPFLVLSLKAGGTGLNLTAASHVIHFDRWWNPAVENQATDRAFRIGQHRNVLVHKFVCRGTVEERIDSLIEEKTQLASDLLEGGAEKMLTEMTDAQLIELVSLDVTRAMD